MNIFRSLFPMQRSISLPIRAVVSDPTRSLALRSGYINKLWTSGDPEAATILVALTADKNPEIRLLAVEALGWLSEDTEISPAQVKLMNALLKNEDDERVEEARKQALRAIKQNKKNTKLENPDNPVNEMFIKVDNDKPQELPSLNFQPPPFLQDLPYSMGISNFSMSDISPDTELIAIPLSGMPDLINGISDTRKAIEGLGEDKKKEVKKQFLEKVIAALKRSKNGTAQPMDIIMLTAFKMANSMIPEEKRVQARKLMDECFPDDIELLKENGFY